MTNTAAGSGSGSSSTKIIIIVIGVAALLLLVTCVGFFAFGSALLLPALGKAQQSAQALRSSMQIQQINMSIDIAAVDTAVQVQSLDDLVMHGYITPDLILSPLGPVGDNRGDYWILFDRPEPDEVSDASSFIIGYDRAMYEQLHIVSTCVLDGTCDVLELREFEALLAHPVNEGRDFNLPRRQSDTGR